MTSLTKEVCEPLGIKPRDAERSKNFFALGLVSWMYTRPVEPTEEWIDEKFAKNEQVAAANKAAFRAGFNFGETTEAVGHRYEVRPATLPAGDLHLDHRQHRALVGPRRGGTAGEAPHHARVVPDHARPATSSTNCPEAQALRHPHGAGRGRDRGRRRRARCVLRRAPRHHDHQRSRASRSRARRSRSRWRSSCRC